MELSTSAISGASSQYVPKDPKGLVYNIMKQLMEVGLSSVVDPSKLTEMKNKFNIQIPPPTPMDPDKKYCIDEVVFNLPKISASLDSTLGSFDCTEIYNDVVAEIEKLKVWIAKITKQLDALLAQLDPYLNGKDGIIDELLKVLKKLFTLGLPGANPMEIVTWLGKLVSLVLKVIRGIIALLLYPIFNVMDPIYELYRTIIVELTINKKLLCSKFQSTCINDCKYKGGPAAVERTKLLNETISSLTNQKMEFQSVVDELDGFNEKVQNELDEQNLKLDELLSDKEAEIDGDCDLDMIEYYDSEIESVESRIDDLELQLGDDSVLMDLMEQITAIDEQIDRYKTELSELNDQSNCPILKSLGLTTCLLTTTFPNIEPLVDTIMDTATLPVSAILEVFSTLVNFELPVPAINVFGDIPPLKVRSVFPRDYPPVTRSIVENELDKRLGVSGIEEWVETKEYNKDEKIKVGSKYYYSLIKKNKGNDPSSSPKCWSSTSKYQGPTDIKTPPKTEAYPEDMVSPANLNGKEQKPLSAPIKTDVRNKSDGSYADTSKVSETEKKNIVEMPAMGTAPGDSEAKCIFDISDIVWDNISIHDNYTQATGPRYDFHGTCLINDVDSSIKSYINISVEYPTKIIKSTKSGKFKFSMQVTRINKFKSQKEAGITVLMTKSFDNVDTSNSWSSCPDMGFSKSLKTKTSLNWNLIESNYKVSGVTVVTAKTYGY